MFPSKKPKFDFDDPINKVYDMSREKERSSCQNFLVKTELGDTRHKMFSYASAIGIKKIMDEIHKYYCNCLECAAKMDLLFGVFLKKPANRRFR